ncbi:unnamed protein product [Miscanthus lutarioriparius]|uniref:Uncharacterized protein n=1 Tax=Miscanthus lutarioriparius TaxID=422564 RepID=A0A811S3R0_9POAL|nr:unnamed protein product [Miscanthus lutarioriparius]
MDPLDTLPFRFHYGGEFLRRGNNVYYLGEEVETCIEMANNTEEGDVAEIYVEGHAVDDEEKEDDEDNNFEDEIEGEQEEHDDSEFEGGYEELTDSGEDVLVAHNKHESREDVEKQIKFVREWYNPSKMDKGKQVVDDQGSQPVASQQNISSVLNDKENLEDNSDSGFLPGDDNSSEEDEEVVQIQKKFKEFKKSMNSGQVANLDDVILDRPISGPTTYELDDDANDTPYANSSAEDESEEEASEGHLETKNNYYPRFKKNVPSPRFVIGMKFTGKKQFKKAVIRQSLLERRVIRRDNKLVTASRIAEKYEKFIMDNPIWSLERMRTIAQEEMFAMVSISKLKRAKAIVMQKVLDGTKGQYQLLYRYQLELLRSNPGSTVIVKKELQLEPPVF